MSFLFLTERIVRRNPLFCNSDDLTGADIPDKFSANALEGAAFRSQDIGVVSLSKTQRFQTKGIPDADELSGAGDDQTISSPDHTGCFQDSLFYSLRGYTFSCDTVGDYL